MKNKVNLDGFCEVQKNLWDKCIREKVESDLRCVKCDSNLLMSSKWRASCVECGTKHQLKKPKNFPKKQKG